MGVTQKRRKSNCLVRSSLKNIYKKPNQGLKDLDDKSFETCKKAWRKTSEDGERADERAQQGKTPAAKPVTWVQSPASTREERTDSSKLFSHTHTSKWGKCGETFHAHGLGELTLKMTVLSKAICNFNALIKLPMPFHRTVLKIHVKAQKLLDSRNNPERKEHFWSTAILDSILHYRARVTKAA